MGYYLVPYEENFTQHEHGTTLKILSKFNQNGNKIILKKGLIPNVSKNLTQNVENKMSHSKCLKNVSKNVSFRMFHLKFLTENVSSKMSHSECLIQSVSFEMSQQSFIQNISKNV